MRIQTKLLIAFSIIGVIFPIYGVIAYIYLGSIQNTINIIIKSDAKVMDALADINFSLNLVDNAFEDALLANDNQSRINSITYIKKNILDIEENVKDWKKAIYFELNNPSTSKELIPILKNNLNEQVSINNELTNYVNQVQQYLENPINLSFTHKRYIDVLMKFRIPLNRVQDKINKIRDNYDADIQFDHTTINNSFRFTKILGIILISTTLIMIFLLAYAIARPITNRLNQLKKAANSISNKNYSVILKDDVGDELSILSQSFMEMAASIRKSNQYIENIIKTLPNIFIVTSLDSKIKNINQATINSLGYKEEELLKMSLPMLLLQEFKNKIKDIDTSEKMVFIRKDGSELPALMSASTLKFEADEPEIIYIAQDITALGIAERKIITSARQAGMADIATNVLHNVGNVLNSLSTSAVMINEKIEKSQMDNLHKLSVLLNQHQNDIEDFLAIDKNGKIIPKYISTLSDAWVVEKSYLLNEIISLKKNIDHIRNIIITQQSLNKAPGITEETSVVELFEEAVALNKAIYARVYIEITRDFNPVKKIVIDRIKLMQIIVNLIKNSVDSLLESQVQLRKLELVLREKNENNFIIQIKDNGIGISPENVTKIFSHGFTTKKKGHGFGLHASALGAKEMGGSLKLYSEGIGKGATFTLELPYYPPINKLIK